MNKLYFTIVGIIIFCLFSGCNQDNKSVTPVESVLNIPVNKVQMKSFIESNTYLDVDIDQLSKAINSWSRSSIDTTAMGKTRVALYRFYSHVKVIDGK